VATLYDVGERLHITGLVPATDHNDVNYMTIGLYRDPGGDGNQLYASSPVSGNSRFDVALPTFNVGAILHRPCHRALIRQPRLPRAKRRLSQTRAQETSQILHAR